MLIECPECKNQISDKAEFCPHCGYPMNAINTDNCCNINGIIYDLTEILELLPEVGEKDTDTHPLHLVGIINHKTSLDWNASKELIDIVLETKKIPTNFSGTIEVKQVNSTPKCPTCQSTNIKKISTTVKATNTVLFGLLGTKRHKTFHCNNCGYEW